MKKYGTMNRSATLLARRTSLNEGRYKKAVQCIPGAHSLTSFTPTPGRPRFLGVAIYVSVSRSLAERSGGRLSLLSPLPLLLEGECESF